jgi:hypothetical protein
MLVNRASATDSQLIRTSPSASTTLNAPQKQLFCLTFPSSGVAYKPLFTLFSGMYLAYKHTCIFIFHKKQNVNRKFGFLAYSAKYGF